MLGSAVLRGRSNDSRPPPSAVGARAVEWGWSNDSRPPPCPLGSAGERRGGRTTLDHPVSAGHRVKVPSRGPASGEDACHPRLRPTDDREELLGPFAGPAGDKESLGSDPAVGRSPWREPRDRPPQNFFLSTPFRPENCHKRSSAFSLAGERNKN